MKPKIIALVPMRHDSERVPGKNYRLFGGQPLFYVILKQLSASPYINKIVIDTDSPIIKNDVLKNFPSVQIIDRPEQIRGGDVPMNKILLYDVTQVKADYYLQTHSTNPLLTTETITKAIDRFLANKKCCDSLFSVTKVQKRFWDVNTKAVNHDSGVLLRTQDLSPLFEENSCLYLFSKDSLDKNKNRIGEKPLMYEVDRLEAWDIDNELDFKIAELIYLQKTNI